VNIPANQGIFVVDATSGDIYTVAKSGQNDITDFLYWVFSGAPPGVGGEIMGLDPDVDASSEPPRWRSSAFSALSGGSGKVFQTVFKANRGGVDGLYLRKDALTFSPLVTVAQILGSGALNAQRMDLDTRRADFGGKIVQPPQVPGVEPGQREHEDEGNTGFPECRQATLHRRESGCRAAHGGVLCRWSVDADGDATVVLRREALGDDRRDRLHGRRTGDGDRARDRGAGRRRSRTGRGRRGVA